MYSCNHATQPDLHLLSNSAPPSFLPPHPTTLSPPPHQTHFKLWLPGPAGSEGEEEQESLEQVLEGAPLDGELQQQRQGTRPVVQGNPLLSLHLDSVVGVGGGGGGGGGGEEKEEREHTRQGTARGEREKEERGRGERREEGRREGTRRRKKREGGREKKEGGQSKEEGGKKQRT